MTPEQLDAALDDIRAAPRDAGPILLISRRPAPGTREVLDEATLDATVGLVGDGWAVRGKPGKPPVPGKQLTIVAMRAVRVVTDDWELTGDQLYVDLDLSAENLLPGTRLSIGDAVIEVSKEPHIGCKKFTARFGLVATRWTTSATGRALNLRGLNARVIEGGTIRRGDTIAKVMPG